ncbi:MAG: CRISPR-associated protein (Cas_NE0113) [Syntrophus sp. PtaU1.Bin208]|nr:MAG: CRISPR-associated protein (Cas_NE0113) [Syntrophus sp. PtaU1.Bin208]
MKKILLAVTGLSPQILTETLYALHQQDQTVHAIHVITTREGKEQINTCLLSPSDGQYYRYLREYGISPASIAFGTENIHVVKDRNGIEIDDIADGEDNERLLEICLSLTFQFTQDPDTAVFFSIAGGRKTMSACLMTAAHLYGRPQDRVYHVLVSPEFESSRDFFYPPRNSSAIELIDRKGERYVKETRYARISLISVPFVSVRNRIVDDLLKEPLDPPTLMLSLIREEPASLTIDLSAGKLIFKGRELDMPPTRLALYAFFAGLKKDCRRTDRDCLHCTDCYLNTIAIEKQNDQIAELYKRIAFSRDFHAMREASDGGILNLDELNFKSYRSRIRRDLEKGFGLAATRFLEIIATGKRPDTRYGIPFERERIRMIY